MAKCIVVLRKSSIKRTLALATILIVLGLNLSHPFRAQAAESNLYYLYPYPSNNPSQTVLFWSEADPRMGVYTLPMWSRLEPNKQIVIGLPEGYQINSAMIADNLGRYITTRIGNRLKNGKKVNEKTPPKSSITYEREITPDGIKERVKVEIGEHFDGNDNFEKYLEIVKKNLTNKNELPDRAPVPAETPAPQKDDNAQATMLLGNTILLGGLALLAKVLVFAL